MNTSFITRFPPLIKHFGLGMFLLGATLAIGVVLSSQAVGQAIASYSKSGRTIRVKGLAEIMVMSDQGTWMGVVSASAITSTEACVKLDLATTKLIALCSANQFKPEEISFSALGITPVYVKNDKGVSLNKVDYFVASQSVIVSSERVEAIRLLGRKAGDLQKEGVQISSGDLKFICTSIENMKMALLEKATENGYNRALVLAKSSGSKVGTLQSASQGVFQIVPFGSNDVSDYGMNDTTSIKKTAKAVVSLDYFIEN